MIINNLEQMNKRTQTILFVLIPCIMILLLYLFPIYSAAFIIFSLGLLLVFIIRVLKFKRENFLLIAAIVPNTIGPLISQIALSKHNIPVAENSGLLVGYAFHISSVLILVLFVLLDVHRRSLIKLCMIVILALVFNILLVDPHTVWLEGPNLFMGLSAPPISPLFTGRCVLTILSTYVVIHHDNSFATSTVS